MARWSLNIPDSDVFLDVKDFIRAEISQGTKPEQATDLAKSEFGDQFADCDDRIDALYGLAAGLWECNALDVTTLSCVQDLIQKRDADRILLASGATTSEIAEWHRSEDEFLQSLRKENPNQDPLDLPSEPLMSERIIDRVKSPRGEHTAEYFEILEDNKYYYSGIRVTWPVGPSNTFFAYRPQSAVPEISWISEEKLSLRVQGIEQVVQYQTEATIHKKTVVVEVTFELET